MKPTNENANMEKMLSVRKELTKLSIIPAKTLDLIPDFGFTLGHSKKMNDAFEDLSCVGYNPDTTELTATIRIKRPNGYGGDLCDDGTREYVRFYMDLDDGTGWQDMGISGVNVHDVPTSKDCIDKDMKPLSFTVRRKVQLKHKFCHNPFIAKIKAVLTWNTIPAPNDPSLTAGTYVWGDVMQVKTQIKPIKFIVSGPVVAPAVTELLAEVVKNPSLSLSNIVDLKGRQKSDIVEAQSLLDGKELDLAELLDFYKESKADVQVERAATKLLASAETASNLMNLDIIKTKFAKLDIDFNEIFAAYLKTNCNTTYEQLNCVGFDYHRSALVGTFNIKRPFGYGGQSCTKGSKEYVTFWYQHPRTCKWKKAGVSAVRVYDIPGNSDDLSFSAILPVDFTKLRRRCGSPRVMKIRAVLSWNFPATTLSCKNWGNAVESFIQLKPRVKVSTLFPNLLRVGGIPVDEIGNVSGLTLPGAKLSFTQTSVETGAPFGGLIVVQGITDAYALQGLRYRIKVTNLDTSGSYYHTDDLVIDGFNPGTGDPTSDLVMADASGFYAYRRYYDNFDGVLARIRPGGNDRIRITIELQNGNERSQVIQMDNTYPTATISVNDGGNCSHYSQGDVIIGSFVAKDNYLSRYRLATNLHASGSSVIASGTINVNFPQAFNVPTAGLNKNCGNISLTVYQKTVWDSVRINTYNHTNRIICIDV